MDIITMATSMTNTATVTNTTIIMNMMRNAAAMIIITNTGKTVAAVMTMIMSTSMSRRFPV